MCLKDICRFLVQIMLGYQGKIAVLCTWGPDRCLDSLSNSWKVKKLPRWSVASCDLYQLLLLASWQWLTSHSLLLLVGWSKENEFPSWILLCDELASERAWLCVIVDLCLALAHALGTCREDILAYWLPESCPWRHVPQQLWAGPLVGRRGRHSTSERKAPMLPQEIMSEIEACFGFGLVGGHQQSREWTEPGRYCSLLC